MYVISHLSFMKKILAAMTFAAGAVFGMFFSPKKGEDLRKEVKSAKSNEDKAEVVGEEAKKMAKSFWKTIKGPLKKGMDDMRKEMEKQSKKYGTEAKKSIDKWKKKAEAEIRKDLKKAKTTAKKKATAAKKNVKKRVSKAKK